MIPAYKALTKLRRGELKLSLYEDNFMRVIDHSGAWA
jgi:hypothetical protein